MAPKWLYFDKYQHIWISIILDTKRPLLYNNGLIKQIGVTQARISPRTQSTEYINSYGGTKVWNIPAFMSAVVFVIHYLMGFIHSRMSERGCIGQFINTNEGIAVHVLSVVPNISLVKHVASFAALKFIYQVQFKHFTAVNRLTRLMNKTVIGQTHPHFVASLVLGIGYYSETCL